MEENSYIERIHKYLNEEMSVEEKAGFEEELAANGQLAEDVATERKLLAGIQLAGDDDLRNSIAAADGRLAEQRFFEEAKIVSIHSSTSSKIINMKKIMSIAAAAVVLVGLVWWGFFRQTPAADPAQLFADNFKPETTKSKAITDALESQGLLGSDSTDQDSLRHALALYNEGKYNDACAAFDSILVRHPANDTAQFYLGMGHLNESRYARAVELLEPITTSETSAFKLDALWYLGLCYFKVDGGFPKAEEIFNQLASNPESKDQQAAKGILQLIGH